MRHQSNWRMSALQRVARLLCSRQDVLDRYSRAGFETAFAERFDLASAEPLSDSGTILYLWRSRG